MSDEVAVAKAIGKNARKKAAAKVCFICRKDFAIHKEALRAEVELPTGRKGWVCMDHPGVDSLAVTELG